MNSQYHLAIDIGASSGRHILGRLEDGRICLEEVYRFSNSMENKDGRLCWDTERLYNEILYGMAKCAEIGKFPASAGIDTWGVDFVLLDESGELAAPAVGYRDKRTEGMPEEVFKRIPKTELYSRTGIQDVIFNTIYQLMAIGISTPSYFERAKHLLLMSDYFHYRLSGIMKTEYTIATTTGLVNARTKNWDNEVIGKCGFPPEIFCPIAPAGTYLGSLTDEAAKKAGYDCKVVLPPAHDTACAFLAVPAKSEKSVPEPSVYISSGTWSVMGVELTAPDTSEAGRMANFSNEGGYEHRFRYVTNIMGLWMIQSVRKELGGDISYTQFEDLARVSDYPGTADTQDNRFFAPVNMTAAIREACSESGFKKPETPGDLARCIYRSLAITYAKVVKEIETLTGKRYACINVIGGGSQNSFLNEQTAETCGIPVYAGPAEGTALGNIVSQMIASGSLSGVEEARRVIRRSFEIKKYGVQ